VKRTSKTRTSWYGDFPWYNIFSTFKEWASPIYENKTTRGMIKYNCFTLEKMPEKYCNTEQLEVWFNAKIAIYRMPNSGIRTRKK